MVWCGTGADSSVAGVAALTDAHVATDSVGARRQHTARRRAALPTLIHVCTHTHTHTRLTALFPGLPGCSGAARGGKGGRFPPMDVRKDRYTANLLKSYRTEPYKFPMHCSKCVSCWGTSYSRPLLIRHSPLLQNPGGATARVSRCQKGETNLGPDLRNISRQSYDYLMIMTKLRSTNEGRFNLKNILRRTQGFC